MGFRWRIALLLALAGAALFTGTEAMRSLRPVPDLQFPAEVYARYARNAGSAVCYLRQDGDYVAIFPDGRSREPSAVTDIELRGLRRADRAMIEAGIPVASRQELLQLLEDLGS